MRGGTLVMVNVMTLGEVAHYLHVHPSTVYRLLKEKRIPAFKMGSDWRFNQESIERWMERMESERTANEETVSPPLSQISPTPTCPSTRGRIRADTTK